MSAPRTQRGFALYRQAPAKPEGSLYAVTGMIDPEGGFDVPVLVVPEAAVKGCKHPNDDRALDHAWCGNCGALWNERTSRWQLPRVLRVAKGKRG